MGQPPGDLVEFTIADDGEVTLKSPSQKPTNVFEWCLEHADVDGDDRLVLRYLAFHATDDALSPLPYDSDYEDDLNLGSDEAYTVVEQLINTGLLAVNWETCTYAFPAYEAWQAQQ